MKLFIFKDTRTRVPASRLKRLFELVSKEDADPLWSSRVNLIFTSDRRIRDMNKTFRSIDKATDVLSFNIDDPALPNGTFGEVYISVTTATRQAREYETTLTREYLHLACHGFLHLCGYDHVDPADEKKMAVREEYFLSLLGGTTK